MHTEHAIAMPITLTLHGSEEPLQITDIIRIVPKRRLVAFGNWGNHPVVAKLFYDSRKAKIHSDREMLGSKSLVAAGVPTPKILFHGTDQEQQIHIIIFERIFEAESLSVLAKNTEDEKNYAALMHAMTIEIATQHVLGVMQNDLHFKNFLISKHQIYTLDGGTITSTNHPLEKNISVGNLALFLSQMGVGHENLQLELFRTYFQARGWLIKEKDYQLLHAAINKWNHWRWRNYQKKIFRDSSSFGEITTSKSRIIYNRDYHGGNFLAFLQNPEPLLLHPQLQILKNGNSSTVVKFELDGQTFVVKRYNMKNIWHRLRRAFRTTRAASCWQLAHCLLLMGIKTAKPIALIENRFLGLRGTSYLVMEYVNGKHAGEYFAGYNPELPQFKIVASRIIALLQKLAVLSLTHGDLKMTNILIEHQQPILLDLDGMKKHNARSAFKRAYANELARLLRNWQYEPAVKEMFEEAIHS